MDGLVCCYFPSCACVHAEVHVCMHACIRLRFVLLRCSPVAMSLQDLAPGKGPQRSGSRSSSSSGSSSSRDIFDMLPSFPEALSLVQQLGRRWVGGEKAAAEETAGASYNPFAASGREASRHTQQASSVSSAVSSPLLSPHERRQCKPHKGDSKRHQAFNQETPSLANSVETIPSTASFNTDTSRDILLFHQQHHDHQQQQQQQHDQQQQQHDQQQQQQQQQQQGGEGGVGPAEGGQEKARPKRVQRRHLGHQYIDVEGRTFRAYLHANEK